MGYLDDRQRIVTTVKAIDGLGDKITAINSSASLDNIATGIEIDLTAGQLNPTFWEPYTIRLDVAFPDCSIGNWIGILATTDGALDVEKLGSNAQGAFNLSGTINDIQNTTTPIYCCVLPTSALPSDVQIDFVSLRVYDVDYNTVPDSNYSCDFVGFAPETTPLATPTGLNADQITSSGATISWTAVENASSYEITYTPSGGTSTTVTSSTTSVALTNLSGATSYAVEVVAVGDGSTYTDSESVSTTFTTLASTPAMPPTPPATPIMLDAPVGFNVVLLSDTAHLSWDGVYGASSYSVRYRVSGASSWTTVSSSTLSVFITSLTPAATYEWQIKAIGDGTYYEDSGWMVAGQFTVGAQIVGTIGASTVRKGYNETITISYSNYTSRIIHALSVSNSSQVAFDIKGKSKHMFPTLYTGGYTAQVSFTDTYQEYCPGTGTKSFKVNNSDGTTASNTIPAASEPTTSPESYLPFVISTVVVKDTAYLSWDAQLNYSNFIVGIKKSTDSSWTDTTLNLPLSHFSFRSHTFTGLEPDTTYDVVVLTMFKGIGYPASPAQITTPPALPAPSNLSATTTDITATLSWDAVTDAEYYTVSYKRSVDSTYTTFTTGKTAIVLTGLTANMAYNWKVTAIDKQQQYFDSESNVANFTTLTEKPSSSALTPLATPSGLNAVILEDNAYLSWDGTPGATGYVIQYTDTTTNESLYSTSTIPAVQMPLMTPSHTYNWSIRANGDEINNGNSAWSASGSFVIGPSLITDPLALRDSAVSSETSVRVREYNYGWFSYAKIRLSTSDIWLTAGYTKGFADFTFPANQLSKGDYRIYGCLYDKAQYYVPKIDCIGSFSKIAASGPMS